MHSETQPNLPQKKRNILWLLAGLFLLLLGVFFFQLFGPNPPLIVSPQTTYATEPLGSDGLPDYEQYVLNSKREGVIPQNNAAVLLLKALGPGDLNAREFAAIAAEIDLPQLPSKDEILVPPTGKVVEAQINQWLKTQVPANAEGQSDAEPGEDLVSEAMSRPWTSEQIPPLAKWVADNQIPIDLLVEAAKRPQLYWPSPTLLNDQPDMLISLNLSNVQSMREAARALSVRAMWHLGEGRPMEAWQDIQAIHRIARMTAQGNTLIEQLVAFAIGGIACEGTQTLVAEAELTAEQSRQILREFGELPRLAGMARSMDRGERLFAVDALTQLANRGDSDLFESGDLDGSNVGGILQIVSVDWNLVLRDTNLMYDRLAAAASQPDRPSRVAAMETFQADINQLFAEARTPMKLLAGLVSRRQRSELVAANLFGLFLPAMEAAFDAEDRETTKLELTRLAIALAVYRSEHGNYPDKLDDLAPSVLDAVPVDMYHAKPFLYKRDDESRLLYSAGENGVDDAGSNVRLNLLNGHALNASGINSGLTIPSGADDISIRLPRPPATIPQNAPPSGE